MDFYEFRNQADAIAYALEKGAIVFIDESAHDLIDRGYTAIKDQRRLVLNRVALTYKWTEQ